MHEIKEMKKKNNKLHNVLCINLFSFPRILFRSVGEMHIVTRSKYLVLQASTNGCNPESAQLQSLLLLSCILFCK